MTAAARTASADISSRIKNRHRPVTFFIDKTTRFVIVTRVLN
jgi:hypothetical protein